MTSRTLFSAQRRPGYLLLMVLVFVFLASVIVVSVLESATRNIRSAAAAAARDDLRITAFSAMEVALASLAEIKELDESLNSPSQGWGNPLSYAPIAWPGGMKVTVEILDETGKLPLDPPDRDTLQQLLEQLGVPLTESDELIDAYLDWTDDDDLERLNGAEADYYERQTPSRLPSNGPITSYDAFRYIKGFDELFFDEKGAPNQLFKVFKESTSLKHGHAVNINTTSPAIRGMLSEHSGLDTGQLQDLELGLDNQSGTEDDGWITSDDEAFNVGLSGESMGYEAHVFRIVVRVEQGEKRFQVTALVDDGSSSSSESNANGDSGGNGEGNNLEGDNTGNSGGSGRPGISTDSDATDKPSEDDSESSDNGNDDGPVVLYSNGDWRFLELTENGPKDD